MNFAQLAKTRFSVRMYADKPIEKEKLELILEAGRVAPTAKNLQPQRVYVLQGKEALTKIREITTCAFNAPVVLLICVNKEEAWKNIDNPNSTYITDASIVTTHMMLQAADLGIGSCWVGRFEAKKVAEAFNIVEPVIPCCLLPIGYQSSESVPSPRHELRKPIEETVKYL